MDEITALPLDEPGGELFAAMAYLAAVAYPESTTKRDRAIEAMKAMMLRAARRHGLKYGKPPMLAQQQHGTLRRLASRLQKRLAAAEAAAWFVFGTRTPGRAVKLGPAEIQRARFFVMRAGGRIAASADEIRRTGGGILVATHRTELGPLLSVNHWSRREQMVGVGDFERDTWRSSRAVLHLAFALRGIRRNWTDPRGFGLFTLLANPQWVREALPSSERWLVLLEHAAQRHPALETFRHLSRVRLVAAVPTVEIPPPGGL